MENFFSILLVVAVMCRPSTAKQQCFKPDANVGDKQLLGTIPMDMPFDVILEECMLEAEEITKAGFGTYKCLIDKLVPEDASPLDLKRALIDVAYKPEFFEHLTQGCFTEKNSRDDIAYCLSGILSKECNDDENFNNESFNTENYNNFN